jgi:uncharacterized protein
MRTLPRAATGLMVAWTAVALPASGVAQPSAVPPPPEQQTADCIRPVFATDQLVCRDQALRQLDSQLAAALRTFDSPSGIWLEPQTQWFLRRSRCAFQADHRQCVELAYAERLAIVRPLSPHAVRASADCNDASIKMVAIEQDRVSLFDATNALLGVGLTSTTSNIWVPFLNAIHAGRNLEASSPSSDVLRCRLTFSQSGLGEIR